MAEDVTEMLNSSKNCSRIMDMTVTLLGQAINAILYYRRHNALMSIIKGDKTKVKDIMTENKEILREDTTNWLFGEKFDDRIMEFVKLKKKSKEFFNIMDGKSKVTNYPNKSTIIINPFVGATLPIHSEAGGRVATSTPKEIKTKIETIELVSQTFFHSSTKNSIPVLTVQDYPKVHRLVMNLFKTKIKAGIPLAGRTKYFLEN